MDTSTPLSIGALAKRAGVSVQAVRYYERLGLMPQPRRASGEYRKYDETAVARLRFIRRAADLGFTLAETKDLLSLRARPGAPCKSVRARAREKLAAIEHKLAELEDLRRAVAALVDVCGGDTAVEHCSILAALSEPQVTQTDEERSPSWPTRRSKVPPPRVSRASRRANGA
ncbi:Heavy metal resistance transcriptional regulator HmrR [Labilithrix luteola]|uniref:Heavy metal resistance transcriptional regulator HmrR n=1 Tax=Labilithrix luteola TaxID=1391654 RepID=A0A0K1PRJ1_9BACT|nr:heavy metal-responsive transcriptional regulator [Labilithrix luteola]AKU95719.1 Heavy metal resistance transcriptional regulator HmrR [Labilithrix luteola]